MGIEENYRTDPARLEKLQVELLPPVPFNRVIATMSKAVMNPVVYRPLFECLRFVTCRTFETVAAGTIPLFVLDEEYVREIFGEEALELVLRAADGTEKIIDILERPQHYAEIVSRIRRRFAQEHSPEARVRELVRIVAS